MPIEKNGTVAKIELKEVNYGVLTKIKLNEKT